MGGDERASVVSVSTDLHYERLKYYSYDMLRLYHSILGQLAIAITVIAMWVESSEGSLLSTLLPVRALRDVLNVLATDQSLKYIMHK